jgi:hypothetical protein
VVANIFVQRLDLGARDVGRIGQGKVEPFALSVSEAALDDLRAGGEAE